MQFQFRIDDSNSVTFNVQLANADSSGFADGPEVIAATVLDEKLSQLSFDQIVGLAAQLVDYFSRPQESGIASRAPDWFEQEWLPATRNANGED